MYQVDAWFYVCEITSFTVLLKGETIHTAYKYEFKKSYFSTYSTTFLI